MSILNRLQHAWNAFVGNENNSYTHKDIGYGSSFNPGRIRISVGNERSIITSVYNRMAIDCSGIAINHVKLDDSGRMIEIIKSDLNNCLTMEANKDQHSRAFIQDAVMSLFDEGVVAIVPIDTDVDPVQGTYNIETMRTGKIIQWYPDHVQVEVYNDRTGHRENITVEKKDVAIIENPLYSIMNEKNSVLQRLIMKLNLLDAVDQQSSSGKLDLIVQLPYIVKSPARKKQAEERRADIESQLTGSKYGIAYTDGTEKITQLNRSVENNLLKQIEYLTSMLYSQLGITTSIMDGTANDTAMLNYMNRTVEPIISALVLEMNRKFLTKTKRMAGESIRYFNDLFKLMPVDKLAEVADKFTRNEIISSNEMRQILGLKPSLEPGADQLRNKNINPSGGDFYKNQEPEEPTNNIEGA